MRSLPRHCGIATAETEVACNTAYALQGKGPPEKERPASKIGYDGEGNGLTGGKSVAGLRG